VIRNPKSVHESRLTNHGLYKSHSSSPDKPGKSGSSVGKANQNRYSVKSPNRLRPKLFPLNHWRWPVLSR